MFRRKGTCVKTGPALWWARIACKVRGHKWHAYYCWRCQRSQGPKDFPKLKPLTEAQIAEGKRQIANITQAR